MDASYYVQNDNLIGQILIFEGVCLTNTIDPAYTTTVFIKEFNDSYSLVNQDIVTPVSGQPFSLFLVSGSGTHIQYGFETRGVNASPTNLANLGKVVFAVAVPDPQVSDVASKAAVEGQSATFTATASGTAPFYYQWFQVIGGVTNVLSDGGRFLGTTTNSLTITGIRRQMRGYILSPCRIISG
ncbi:MAG: immunoglobulin domain-containing protein [Limisphaerales bacterium]